MQSNSVNGQPDIANITVVTDERQVIVPQAITSVVEVNNPGPQGPVGPQGVAGPSEPFANIGNGVYATTSSLQVTGSFLVSGSSTFTNIGPAVFSGSVNATGGVTMSSALVSGNVTVLGTASINVLQINTTINSTGSNTLGDAANDTQTLYGSVIIPTGSLTVSGNVSFGTSSAGFYWDNTNGYLGIKKTNPAVEIDVVGSIRATGTVFNSTTQTQIIQINSGVSALRFFSGSVETARYDGNNWGFYTTTPTARLQIKGSGATSATTALRVENTNASASLVVLDSGYVGIGTITPSSKLYISGSTSEALLIASSSNGPALYVSGSGNVGIGTTTPSYRLDVSGSGNFTANLTVTGSTTLHNGQTTIQGAGATSATTALLVRNSNASSALTITNARSSSFGGNVDIAGDLSATNSSSTRKFQSGYFYDIHPEASNAGIIPFYSNDIAYNTLRGGQFTASFGSGSTYTLNTSQIEAIFDGSPNYCIMDPTQLSGSMTASIVFPQTYTFGNIIGFSFGNPSWVARDFTVEILVTGSYVTLDTQTGYTAANYTKYFQYAGLAVTGARITFSNFATPASTSGFRIAEIFLLNYNGQLGKAVFMGRDGGAVYKPITIQSGSTSTPAYSSLTDTNTGIYFPAADTLGFVEGGVEAMRINSSGQVGIGTTSPAFTLDVSGSGRFTNGLTVTGSLIAPSITGSLQGTASYATSATTALRVENTNASASLVVLDDGKVTIGRTDGAYVEVGTLSNFYNTSVGYNHIFRVGGSEVARITGTGNVLIGSTTDNARLYIYGPSNSALLEIDSPAVNNILFVSGSGNVGIGTNVPAYTLEVGGPIYSSPGQLLITASGSVGTKEGAFIAAGTDRTLQMGIADNSVVPVGIDMFETNNTFGSTYLNFRVNNANLVRMTGSFVGIGTTSPAYALDLYGTYHQYQAQGEIARYDIANANADQNRGVWNFYTNASATADFFGRFGFKFEGGTSDAFKQFQVHVADSTTPKFVVDGSGRMGIGTTSSLTTLDVRTTNNSSITPLSIAPNDATTLLVGNTGTNGVLAFGQNNTGQGWVQGRSRLAGASANPILLNPLGGNILVGTTTDVGYRLNVSGSVNISNILTLTPQSPLPSGVATGSFAVSSSIPPKPYFYDGTTWNALY